MLRAPLSKSPLCTGKNGGAMCRRCIGRQRGVGMIDFLVAVLVLTIGMLGMAGLQSWTLKNNESSLQRGMAVVQAYYIADVMRADRLNAVNGVYDLDIGDPSPVGTDFASTARADWRTSIQDVLGPDATGAIDCNGPVCDVIVRWNDSRSANGLEEQDVLVEVAL